VRDLLEQLERRLRVEQLSERIVDSDPVDPENGKTASTSAMRPFSASVRNVTSASRSAPNVMPNRPLSEAAARTMKSCVFKAHFRDQPS
jgi:hypothetical protein